MFSLFDSLFCFIVLSIVLVESVIDIIDLLLENDIIGVEGVNLSFSAGCVPFMISRCNSSLTSVESTSSIISQASSIEKLISFVEALKASFEVLNIIVCGSLLADIDEEEIEEEEIAKELEKYNEDIV